MPLSTTNMTHYRKVVARGALADALAEAGVFSESDLKRLLLHRVANLEGYVTKFTPHKTVKLSVWGKLTFDERVVLHRVGAGVLRKTELAIEAF